MPTVTTIPATRAQYTSAPLNVQQRRKVAAYARVSTDKDDQVSSYQAQVSYYTSYIKSKPEWCFVEVYTDEGITGTSIKHREGFKRMIADALDGRIDLILTKSVSRFARNTVDSLTTIRTLKEKGVECYFEKENIWTFDGKGELLITIMSSLAQEESHSISENITWGQRKRFQDGKVTVPFSKFLGYDRGPDGNLVVNPEQAEVVKRIYSMFLHGMSPYSIAKKLNEDGIQTPGGKGIWRGNTVRSVLTNEKYKGCALLQKKFTTDYLTKKMKVNEGEVPQYYVENSHEAIIEPEVFDLVQVEMKGRTSGMYPFSSKVKCGACGSWYGPKVWHSNTKHRKVIWRCNEKYGKEKGDNQNQKCTTPAFTTEELEALAVKAINQKLDDCAVDMDTVEKVLGIGKLEAKRDRLVEKIELITEKVQKGIRENASVAMDQGEYEQRYEGLLKEYEDARGKLEKVEDEIKERKTRLTKIRECYKVLGEIGGPLESFDEDAWFSLVDHMTVYGLKDVVVTFRDGTEVKVEG